MTNTPDQEWITPQINWKERKEFCQCRIERGIHTRAELYCVEAIDALSAAWARIAELETAQEWRDIESAPKDGSLVDLWIPKCAQFGEAHRSSGEYSWNKESREWELQCGNPAHGVSLPWLQLATHWRPIPAPPAIAESKREDREGK